MSWMTKEDEIKILGMENHNLKKEIEKLKADLKREQSCVDFYANRENWSWVNQNSRISLKTDHEMSLNNTHTVAGKLARLTQQQRREG